MGVYAAAGRFADVVILILAGLMLLWLGLAHVAVRAAWGARRKLRWARRRIEALEYELSRAEARLTKAGRTTQ